MMPDASGWRSSADYDRIDSIVASDLAWEWLRRNDAYDADYAALARTGVDARPLTDTIRQRWGLRFPRRSSQHPT